MFVPSDDQRRMVEQLAGLGLPRDQIASLVLSPATGKGISLNVLYKVFGDELQRGTAVVNAKIAGNLARIASSPDTTGAVVAAAIFWMKTQCGWREVQRMEHTGANGAPLIEGALDIFKGKISRLAERGGENVVDIRTQRTRA